VEWFAQLDDGFISAIFIPVIELAAFNDHDVGSTASHWPSINELTGEYPDRISPYALDVAMSVLDDSFTCLGRGCEKTDDSSYPLPDPDDRCLQTIARRQTVRNHSFSSPVAFCVTTFLCATIGG
jgi:hypothetical protein